MRTMTMVALALVTSAAFASSGEEHGGLLTGDVLRSLGLHAFNLALLLGVLAFFLRGRLRDALKNRSLGVKRAIDEANAMRKDAQVRFEQIERQIESFEHDMATMRRDAERDALAEREAILKRAELEAEMIRQTAERTLRDETERARTLLRQDAARLAIDLAQKRLVEQISAADDERFAKQFLGAVRGSEVADG